MTFTLRQSVEASLNRAHLDRFAVRAARWLRNTHAEAAAGLSDEQLAAQARRTCGFASVYGLRTELEIFRFFASTVLLQDPLLPGSPAREAVELLSDRRVPASLRAYRTWQWAMKTKGISHA